MLKQSCCKCYNNLVVAVHILFLFLEISQDFFMEPYYLLYMISIALFTISGGWIQANIFLYSIKLVGKLILYSVLQSSLYFGNCILETINTFTLYFVSSGSQAMGERNENDMLLLLCPLNIFKILFKVKQVFINIPLI